MGLTTLISSPRHFKPFNHLMRWFLAFCLSFLLLKQNKSKRRVNDLVLESLIELVVLTIIKSIIYCHWSESIVVSLLSNETNRIERLVPHLKFRGYFFVMKIPCGDDSLHLIHSHFFIRKNSRSRKHSNQNAQSSTGSVLDRF